MARLCLVLGILFAVGCQVSETNDPADPANPADPVDSADPANPLDPADPIKSADPADPIKPADPADPIKPADPADPVDPANAVVRADPVKPADPVDPVNPVDPAANPVDPADAVNPADPVNPADQVDPAEPVAPVNSTDPRNPVVSEPKKTAPGPSGTVPAPSDTNKVTTSASSPKQATDTTASPLQKQQSPTIAAAASEAASAADKPTAATDGAAGVTTAAQTSPNAKPKDDVSVPDDVPTTTKSGISNTVKADAASVLPPLETTSETPHSVTATTAAKISQQGLTTEPTKVTQQTTARLSPSPSPAMNTSLATISEFSPSVSIPVPKTSSSVAPVDTITNPAQQPMGEKNLPTVYCRSESSVTKDVVKINVNVSSNCNDNSSFTEEEHKAFKEVCDALKTVYKSSDSNCIIQVASTEGKLAIVETVLEIRVDSSDLYKEVKASMREDKSPWFTYGNEKPSINDDVVSIPLISAIVSLAVALLLIAAIYGCYQQRQTRKREQRLTEELQTMENGYHDNPTLEVMETAPEMQEKKGGPNGELGDSWIVPLDNLTREDLEEEEDTHL